MPTSPPQVRLPTSGPTLARRKYHGMASPPEPAYSLITMALGPKIAPVGVVKHSPSRVAQKFISGRPSRSTM